MGTTSVDPCALRLAAQRLDDAADLLSGVIGGPLAGPHAPEALSRLLADLARWQRAARETAAALRVGADRHTDAEDLAVRRLR